MFVHFAFRDQLVFAIQWSHCSLTLLSSYTNPFTVNPSFRHFFCRLLITVNLQSGI